MHPQESLEMMENCYIMKDALFYINNLLNKKCACEDYEFVMNFFKDGTSCEWRMGDTYVVYTQQCLLIHWFSLSEESCTCKKSYLYYKILVRWANKSYSTINTYLFYMSPKCFHQDKIEPF